MVVSAGASFPQATVIDISWASTLASWVASAINVIGIVSCVALSTWVVVDEHCFMYFVEMLFALLKML